MFITPDNFTYFLILFTVSIFCGTYLLFAYYANKLLIANALILFLAASRVAIEFYLPSFTTYEEANAFMAFHGYGVPINILVALQWICIWFYVRPLKGFKYEKVISTIYLYGLVIIPFTLNSFYMLKGNLFYYCTYKIDGYWKFAVDTDFWFYPFYNYHPRIGIIIILLVLLTGIIRDKKNRVRQIFLFLSYIIIPLAYSKFIIPSEWNTPSSGIIFVVHSLILSWYFSNYRLFKSNIGLITKDVFNSISDLTISTTPSFDITSFNEKAKQFFNIKNKKIEDFFETVLINKEEKLLVNTLLKSKKGTLELGMYDVKGDCKIMNLKLAPFKNGDKVYGYTFLLTDLTKIRAQEEELQQLNNTKDQLFSIIGHDLRKPALEFRGIQNKVNFLIKNNDFSMLQKFGASLEKSAMTLNNLLDNLLNWSRQQQGFISNFKENVQVENTVNEMFEFFEVIAKNKNINLINNVNSETYIHINSNAFSTILRNLIDNAIKFSFPHGKITIKDSIKENKVTITVTDTGIGMDPLKLKSIFNSHNVKRTKGTSGELGSGLGLTLINDFVKANNGSISVKSKLNVGTTFNLIFSLV